MKRRFTAMLAGALLLAGTAFAATVNLNTADKQGLMTLEGIGAAKAEAIISYRENVGPFESVEDLKKVSGIGPATLDKNAENMTVKSK